MLEQLQTPDLLNEADVVAETQKELNTLKEEVLENEPKKVDLKEKPIHLWYKEIYKEKKFSINLPNPYSAQWRILRCMRWKSMTDAVEDKYNIPRWLLLAMMAQEGMGDPTMPNLSWDWWLWLIHIQWVNAENFWLKTLPRYNEWVKDLKHWEEIDNVLKETHDVKKLIKYDDRFHPLMGLDCSARFLKDVYNRTDAWPDRRINALKKYSGRSTLDEYVRPVVKYWLLVNEYTWDSLPNFTTSTNKEIQKMRDAKQVTISWVTVPLDIVKTSSKKLTVTLDWKKSNYENYLDYFNEEEAINYWLNDYKKLWEEPTIFTKSEAIATVSPKKLWEKDPTRKKTENLQYLNKSKDKEWFVYKYTIPSDITSVLDLTKLFSIFAWTTFQVTDEKWDELKRPNIPSKKWEYFYIKEKIV